MPRTCPAAPAHGGQLGAEQRGFFGYVCSCCGGREKKPDGPEGREQRNGIPRAAPFAPGGNRPRPVPVMSAGAHLATSSLSTLDEEGDGDATVAVSRPKTGRCCRNGCGSCCSLAGLKRQLNALVLRLPPSLGNFLSCLLPLCALMLVTFPEHPRNA